MKRTTIMIIVSFLVLAVSFVVSACLAEAPVKHKQTIMIYMTGSDLESRHGAASKDIAEMLGCGHDPETTAVIVMTGGSKEWKDYPGDQSVIYEIAGDRLKELLQDPEAVSFSCKNVDVVYDRSNQPVLMRREYSPAQ